MKKLAAVLITAAGVAVVPVVIAPAANADVCAAGGGRHFSVGGCTNIAGDAAAAAIVSSHDAYYPGEIPCYTEEGVPYFTPDGDPC
jgi:hypothetical protein